MSLHIVPADKLTNERATYLIYGNPGIGKTTALKFVPGKKLVIDIDKSSIVLKGTKDIDIVTIDTHNIWQSWLDTVKAILKGEANNYDTIIVDNVSELFRASLANLGRDGKNHRVPSQSDYQRVDFTILDSLRALKELDKRVVFTAWETTDQWVDENQLIYNRAMPDIRVKILNNFMGLCDVVARLTVRQDKETGETIRGFILQPTNSVYAKNRLDDRLGCKVEDLVVRK